MARKDEIFKIFLKHDLLKSKYKVKASDYSLSVEKALKSDNHIIKAIALIVNALDSEQETTDKQLRDLVLKHLNQTAI